MSSFKRILKLLPAYKTQALLAFVCMAGFAVTNGAMAFLIGPVMKFLFAADSPAPIKLIPFDLFVVPKEYMIMAVPLAIVVVAVAKGVFSYGQSYFMGYVGTSLVRDVRKRLYERILELPVGYFSGTPTGTLISRMTNDVNMLQNMAADSAATVLKQVLTIVVLAVIIVSLDWKLALACSVAMPLSVYPMRRLGKKIKRVTTDGQVSVGTITSLLHEAIVGIRIVKAFCMERYESERFGRENDRFARFQLKAVRIRSLSSPIMETLGAVAFAVTIWYAAWRISNGTLTPEAFISFFAAALMFYQPIKALNGINLTIQQGVAAADRVFEVLDRAPEETKTAGREEMPELPRSVEFRGVTFRYGGEDVLRGIDLRVEKGTSVAIVGSSGAGKTTLLNLLPRFYEPASGTILVDGRDIKEFSLSSLRRRIAIVSQHVVLFNDTVKRNIAYGDTDAKDEEVVRAARAANAHDFIMRLPNGYDTVIGEGGVRLSGGERQRLSIARAIMKNAPILILDEATSSLDAESELEVQKGLDNLMKGRTTFVIAHRLSTVRNADRIVVLSGGSIKETGRHDELLTSGGEYHKLYSMQFR